MNRSNISVSRTVLALSPRRFLKRNFTSAKPEDLGGSGMNFRKLSPVGTYHSFVQVPMIAGSPFFGGRR